MKFNKNYLFNLLLASTVRCASITVSQSELDKFSYGTEEVTLTIHGDT